MIQGLYSSAAGALAESSRHAVISNNLANVSTPGFKADLALFRARDPESVEGPFPAYATPMDVIAGGVFIAETRTRHGQGPVRVTDNPFDLAIDGRGYFAVTDGTNTYYTRAGAFTRDSLGRLAMPNGRYYLADASGRELRVPTHADIQVTRDGTVNVDGSPIAKIVLYDFDDVSLLSKAGSNLYDGAGASAFPAFGRVKQGALETSAVSPVAEMANMIMASRSYEANMQMIKMQDQTLADLVTVGTVNV